MTETSQEQARLASEHVYVEFTIDGAELRQRINQLLAYRYVDDIRLPRGCLVDCVSGVLVPEGRVTVCLTFDPARAGLASLSLPDDDDDDVGDE